MTGGNWVRILAPTGLVLVIIGVALAALTGVFILLDVASDFTDRIATMSARVSLPFILGGVAFVWLGKASPGQ